MSVDAESLVARLAGARSVEIEGTLRACVGLRLEASLPGARIGDAVEIGAQKLGGEIVGFEGDRAILLPLGELRGVSPGDPVRALGHPHRVACSDALLGRVLDGLGRPLDEGPVPTGTRRAIDARGPNPLGRPAIDTALPTGVRVIDGLLTLGRGQRVGLFAGSGVGKSTLLGQLARQTEADRVVVALVGERGREVVEFLDEALGKAGREKSVVVVATSDAPSLERLACAATATSIAEHFRDEGHDVLLLVDSLTRFARAAREVGLAAGEPPARRGYPPSVFARLPRLLERAGRTEAGSITAIYTVLLEGGDMEEPIADEVRGILDGHLIMTRQLAEAGHFPALDPVQSLSRLQPALVDPAHRALARDARACLALHEEKRDLIALGAIEPGRDPRVDRAMEVRDSMLPWLQQPTDEYSAQADTWSGLRAALEPQARD